MVTFLRENTNRSANGMHERRAAMRQQTANEKAFSIEAVLSTEQPVLMWDYDRWEAIDEILLASGRQVAENVSLLDSHRMETINRVLGHVDNIRTEGTDTVGLLLFDSKDAEAVKAFNKYSGNHAKDVSIGYDVTAAVEVKPGESTTIEGRTFVAGSRRLRIALTWVLNELSAVCRGADTKAKVRGEEQRIAQMVQVSPEEIEQLKSQQRSAGTPVESRIESTTETPSVVINITNGQPEKSVERSAEIQPNAGDGNERASAMTTETKPESTGTAVNESEILKRGIQLERKRQADIKAIADGVRSEALNKALDDAECTVDKARELFLKDLQEQRAVKPAGSDAPGMIVSNRERDVNAQSLAIALAKRFGDVNIENVGHRIKFNEFTGRTTFEKVGYKHKERQQEWERNLERADNHLREIHSVDLCREALTISKMESPIERRELVTRAFSTPTVSTIYTTAMGAVLLSNLGDMNDSTQGWTREITVKNYKKAELHRMEGGGLKKRVRGEKAQHAKFADTMEGLKVNDFASVLIIDHQDAIDDELGAWDTALREYARAVKSLRPDVVYAILAANAALETDNTALFHADHSNLLTSSALNMANLQIALAAMASQRGPGGLPLGLRDAWIVTGETLAFTAEQLVSSAEIREAAAANGTANPLKTGRRSLRVQPDSRINGGFTDPLTELAVAPAITTWYVASDKGDYGMTVGYLEGTNGMPTMSTKVLNSEGLYGIALDVQAQVGAGVAGHQGLVKGIA